MSDLLNIIVPELILAVAAGLLFLMGCSRQAAMRRMAAIVAIGALLMAFFGELGHGDALMVDKFISLKIDPFAHYLRLLALGVGALLLLLSFPTNAGATGNSALEFGNDAGEYFAFFLLSISGLTLVCAANDLIVLFLAVELVSIPT